MIGVLRSLWLEPAPSRPRARRPQRGRRLDAALAVVLALVAVLESVVRDDVPGRPVALVAALVILALLAWRRSHPFTVFCAAFAVAAAMNLAVVAGRVPPGGLYASAAILLFPFSLFRWGSGRHAIIGVGVLTLVYASSVAAGEIKDASEAVGSAVVLLLPAAIGAAARFRASAQSRELEAARAAERERIARDLHDTVAHHLSAIAIQAQAGTLVAKARPEAAERALAVIEAEATRALTEMRGLVGTLRAADGSAAAPLAPQPGAADLEALARTLPDGRVVSVDVRGDLGGLSSSMQAAAFRIAQEGVTNAVRHARNATRVSVLVEGDAGGVRVTVFDDGRVVPGWQGGHGLAGMAERAAHLGGTFTAGPVGEDGWRVQAFLPGASVAEEP